MITVKFEGFAYDGENCISRCVVMSYVENRLKLTALQWLSGACKALSRGSLSQIEAEFNPFSFKTQAFLRFN